MSLHESMNSVAGSSPKRLSKAVPLLLLLLFSLVVCCLFFYLPSGRQLPPREGESTVLMNPSTPPCWYDICPGETIKDEAVSILSTIPEVEQGITDRYYENAQTFISFVSWRFADGVAEGNGRFYYRDQTISHITFLTRNILTFGEAIEAFGEPASILPFSTSKWLYIALIYPEDGLYLVYFDGRWIPDCRFELTPEQSVGNVIFYNPAEFEELITRIEGANWVSRSYDDILQIIQPWEGFGEIQVYDPC